MHVTLDRVYEQWCISEFMGGGNFNISYQATNAFTKGACHATLLRIVPMTRLQFSWPKMGHGGIIRLIRQFTTQDKTGWHAHTVI